jgi:hypothetical protein
MSCSAGSARRALRIVGLGWLSAWYVKGDFLALYLLWDIRAHPVIHPLFPPLMRDPNVAAAAYFAPALCLVLLFAGSMTPLRIAAFVMLVSALVLCAHADTYNDVTFMTSFWVALWINWLVWGWDRLAERGVEHALMLAKGVLGMIFFGGAVGKLTSEYLSGEAVYQIYIVQKDYWFYPWLRGIIPVEALRQLATALSWTTIALELLLASAPLWPFRAVFWFAIVTLPGMTLVSTWRLYSVLGSLLWMLVACRVLACPRFSPANGDKAEIPGNQRLAEEHRAHGADGEERPERNGRSRIAATHEHPDEANDGSGKRCNQQGDRNRTPSQKGADHRQELHVAATHPLATGEPEVSFGDGPEQPAAEKDADQRSLPARISDQEGRNETDGDSRKTHHVRNDLMVEVDEAHDDQGAEEHQSDESLQPGTEGIERHDSRNAGEDLDHRVAYRDSGAAFPATASQQQIAHHRDVVVGTDRRAAGRAIGAGGEQRLPGWKPMNANIQKAAHDEPDGEGCHQEWDVVRHVRIHE